MAIEVKHKFVSQKADGADASLIRPSNWNDTHELIMAGPRLLGRVATGQGEAQEISLAGGLAFVGNTLSAEQVVPPSAIMPVARATPPTGWLKANGAAVSRSTYAALFAAIGTTYGAGNGSTTFNLPDYRGEFIRGWDDGRGADSGRARGSAQSDQNKSHTHSGTAQSAGSHSHSASSNSTGSHSHSFSGWATGGAQSANSSSGRAGNPSSRTTSSAGSHSHTITVNSGGAHTHSLSINSNGGNEARPRNKAELICIKF